MGLAWHYNHGAKLVGINVGATEQSLMSGLFNGAFGDEAMKAYRKFLKGEPLSETATVAPGAAGNLAASSSPRVSAPQLVDKMQMIQRDAPAWLQAHPDRESELGPLFERLDGYIKANDTIQALQIADTILRLIQTNPPAN